MTEFAHLPRFVREALEGEAGSGPSSDPRAAGPDAPAGAFDDASAVEFERGLLALERALGNIPGDHAPAARTGTVPAGDADPALQRLLQRLEGTVSTAPYRYAPFFSRAAELFDLPEDAIIAEMSRLADPKVWTFAGLPGISHVTVRGGPRVASAETLFVRFKPGVYFPRHHHTGDERVLVLEGSYEDSHGVQHLPGELRDWPSGTEHSFKVGKETCIFASVVFGRRFYAWPLRALSKLLGR